MSDQIIIELIHVVPPLIWSIVTAIALLVFRSAIRENLLPRITRFKAFGVEVEAAIKQELEKVAEAAPQSVGGSEQRTQVARRASNHANILRGANVLVVDDNPAGMAGTIRILEDLGVNVEIARSTRDAMRALQRKSFDVVNSDMRRGSDPLAGLELIREMRDASLRQPVVLYVGRYEPEKGVPAGAFGITNRIDELINLNIDALERVRT
jgi:CheY-like chemotaxis protein